MIVEGFCSVIIASTLQEFSCCPYYLHFCEYLVYLRKQPANISGLHHWFLREMTSEKRTSRFHTVDASIPRSRQCFKLNEANAQPIKSATQTWIVTRQQYRAFSLTWPASMQIYWGKRKRLHKKRVQLPEDFLGTPTWPPFHCFGTPIWLP